MLNKDEFFERDGKIVIPVPEKIRYMSEWTNFDLDFFGNGAYIIDKQIPGCGFTEYCLTNNDNIVLPSPRCILLDNKEMQHPGDVYYARNECEDSPVVDKNLNKEDKYTPKEYTPEEIAEIKKRNNLALSKMEEGLMKYCKDRASKRKPMKIIVTYDSFKHVKRFLMENNLLPHFKIIVDEFQSIFVDSRFKATTEFEFLEELKGLFKIPICFLSATPMMSDYLKQLDYFKSLPYFELDWGIKEPARVIKPQLKVRKSKSINSDIKRIISEYREGKFAVLANPITGVSVQSKEAVFYVNSVTNILGIVKSEGLKPEEVNILCSNNPVNVSKIKKRLGVKYQIGSVPLKGQPHKMFTFCTRTVYLGADFYSTNARTFIFSDANIDSLAVDISLDLPQILGRQRLIENPWKNHAEFFFKNLGEKKELTKEDFERRIKQKTSKTQNKISLFNKGTHDEQHSLMIDIETVIRVNNYKDDYVSISYVGNVPEPVPNKLVYIAEQRAYDIQQVDYRDRFVVFSTIKSERGLRLDKMSEFIDRLRDTTTGNISERLRMLVESKEFTDDEKKMIAQQVSEKFDQYYNLVGPDRCRALGFNVTYIKNEVDKLKISKNEIKDEFLKYFEVNKRYTNKDIKDTIKKIYDTLGYTRNAKATDINEYFETKHIQVIMPDKSKIHGLEIVSIK